MAREASFAKTGSDGNVFRVTGRAQLRPSPVEVSRFFADVENEKKWQNDLVHVLLVEGRAGEVGARWERVQVVGGRNIKTIVELTVHEPGKRVTFKAEGKVIEYTFEVRLSNEAKGCVAELSLEGEMRGFAAMFEGIAADELREAMPKNVARLEAALG